MEKILGYIYVLAGLPSFSQYWQNIWPQLVNLNTSVTLADGWMPQALQWTQSMTNRTDKLT